MKINFNSLSLGMSGGNRTVLEIANRLTERGHRVTITTLGLPRDARWFSSIKADVRYPRISPVIRGLRALELATRGRCWWRLYDSVLIKLMPECDVNVATYCFTAYPTYYSRNGRPFYLVQNYEPLFFERFPLQERARLTYFLPMHRMVVSRWLADTISQMTGEQPTYIGNGVNTTLFRPSDAPAHPGHRFRVMGIFRGVGPKGEEQLLKSLNLLSKKLPIELVAIGGRRIRGVPYPVENHGLASSARLPEIYSSADVFVFPSEYEGFGLPPLEAMACGTPVVVSHCSGIDEYAVNEYNALVASKEELASSIERICTDKELASRLRQGGFATAKQYDLERVVDRVEKAFSSL
jgi:glycosyltransferase involved in cell wall biosynthesis